MNSTNIVGMDMPLCHVTWLLISRDAKVEDAEHEGTWSEAGMGHALRCETKRAVQIRPHCCGTMENYCIDEYLLPVLEWDCSSS